MNDRSEIDTAIGSRQQEYANRIHQYETSIANSLARWKKMSLIRGVTFLVCVVLLALGFVSFMDQKTIWFILAGVVFIAFVAIAVVHEGIDEQLQISKIWLRLNRWSLARMNRDWDQLKKRDVAIPPEYSGITNDLDLFGRSSLFQLIGDVETPLGIQLMQDWILHGAATTTIVKRQSAIQELCQQGEFRNQLRFSCHLLADGDGGPENLLAWAEAPTALDRNGILSGISRVLAILSMLGLIGLISGQVSLTYVGPYMMALLAINFLMTVFFAGKIHSLFNQVSTRHGEINHYINIFELIEKQDFDCELLSGLKAQLFDSKSNVLHATRHLGRIAWQANLRRHGMLFFAYILFQFLFLWDFHVLNRLQRWKRKHGSSVRLWMNDLAHWEVLAALGQFANDHPPWIFPQVIAMPKNEAHITARKLGHPLLAHNDRVCNDVQVGPPGSVLLVTGSNMSGKSTLLRSIGLNTVLAQMGSPVCATEMELSPLQIETSMRIQDSLADGVSFFMAELRRLKEIVDIAASLESQPQRTVLFLLDEILQGTNSRERHIAVTRVIRYLIDHKAIGAVSTHDLELGKTPELVDACEAIHFRESFEQRDGKKNMTFDYRIHQGIATTTNALELLKLVGLDELEN